MTIFFQHLVDAISLGSLYALGALGIGLIFGIMRLINFAHGDFISIGAYALIIPSSAATATMFIGAWSIPFVIITVILIVVCFALVSERIIFRPLREANPATLLIGSFGLSFLLQHLILMIYGGRPKAVDIGAGLNEHILILGLRIPKLEIVTIIVSIFLLISLAIFLKKTPFGIQMRAAAEDFRTARLLGVRANAVIAYAFALSGLLAATVSILLLAQTGLLSYKMGLQITLIAFVATVIGGMGSLVGATVGGFVVGVASVAMQVILPEGLREARDAFVYAFVILILLLRPQGLIQSRFSKERV
jgi:branched-chain amino acid transport system permease protein